MEFILRVPHAAQKLDSVRDACMAADASALVDLDPRDGELRIATQLEAAALGPVLARAGVVPAPGELEQLPSTCCGGCSG